MYQSINIIWSICLELSLISPSLFGEVPEELDSGSDWEFSSISMIDSDFWEIIHHTGIHKMLDLKTDY